MSKPPVKPTAVKPPAAKEKPKRPQDYSDEYRGKSVKIHLANGSVLEGTWLSSSKYFIKLVKREGGILYINKAWVLMIEP